MSAVIQSAAERVVDALDGYIGFVNGEDREYLRDALVTALVEALRSVVIYVQVNEGDEK